MPWQRMVADVGLELDADGRPAYREVIATVMRQSGKSTLLFTVIGHRCTMWPTLPQRVIYTAQDGSAARRKLIEDCAPLFTNAKPFKPLVERVYRGVGYEGINFRTGSTIRIIGSSEAAGHGATSTGLAGIDESFADVDNRREQAINPTMATVPDAQTWNVSTAGTDASVFLRRKIELGRAAADAGRTSGIAYFEWSIPDDADIDDPETWWAHMPALGWTIGEQVVAHERQNMTEGDWRRSFGNQWTNNDERAIPAVAWDALQSLDASPSGDLRFCLEVDPERASAGVVVHGGGVVELIEHRPGVGWVVDRIAELARRHNGKVVVDVASPAGAMIGELEAAGVDVVKFGSREVVQACGAFFDAVMDRKLTFRSNAALSAAAATVTRRQVSDAWVWSRRAGTGDPYLIMAASLAAFDAHPAPQFFAY
jgi:hypothetical protein